MDHFGSHLTVVWLKVHWPWLMLSCQPWCSLKLVAGVATANGGGVAGGTFVAPSQSANVFNILYFIRFEHVLSLVVWSPTCEQTNIGRLQIKICTSYTWCLLDLHTAFGVSEVGYFRFMSLSRCKLSPTIQLHPLWINNHIHVQDEHYQSSWSF